MPRMNTTGTGPKGPETKRILAFIAYENNFDYPDESQHILVFSHIWPHTNTIAEVALTENTIVDAATFLNWRESIAARHAPCLILTERSFRDYFTGIDTLFGGHASGIVPTSKEEP